MRTFGRPSASTVASDMAVGSRGSRRLASSNQAANSRKGSSASVKSPLVNQVGCSIGPDSDMLGSILALMPSSLSRRSGYKGRPRRWHVALKRLRAGACLLALALAGGGCSFSYQLDTMLAKKDEGKADQAGTLRLAVPKAGAEAPADGDLAIARAAVSEVLTKGGKHTSLPWENPKTGARGTVTPLAATHEQDGITCRDFLASYVKNGSESWLQGEAWRPPPGRGGVGH